ncbi:hypothetical protein G7077_12825 [Sphingomonas piscis]|uniref:Uncharacterized protein n=1 Tax=Sphingomonas piscis TaxID=2714943 RepID=A0A6G7YSE4_9SPHN|nr:hypothetical protein [Sphingomonas piscis]QIK79660.1 hypothetical protein G7077_12825 [Sphingomonas piscis]
MNLYLSREPYLLDEGVPQLPTEIILLGEEFEDRLRVQYTRNTGPYRKLLPYLEENWGLSRLVVTADDDTIYPRNWLTDLLAAHQSLGCSIAFRGHRMVIEDQQFAPYRTWMRSTIVQNPSLLIVGTGKDGILYDTAFFPKSVLDIDAAMRLAPTADDLWLRWNLARNGVPTFVINTDYRTPLDGVSYDASLYMTYNSNGGNNKAISDLDQYFQQTFNFDLKLVGQLPLNGFLDPAKSDAPEAFKHERPLVNDETFADVRSEAALPSRVGLSECWSLDFKAMNSDVHGKVNPDPSGGLRLQWQGAPKFVRLWQNIELSEAELKDAVAAEINLTLEANIRDKAILNSVIIKEGEMGDGLTHKLKLSPAVLNRAGAMRIRAYADGLRLGQQRCQLRIEFNQSAQELVVRSVQGKLIVTPVIGPKSTTSLLPRCSQPDSSQL